MPSPSIAELPSPSIAELANQFVEDTVAIDKGAVPFSQEPTVPPSQATLEAAKKVAESKEKPINAAVIESGNGKGSMLVTSYQGELNVTIRHTPLDPDQSSALKETQVPVFQIEVNPPELGLV